MHTNPRWPFNENTQRSASAPFVRAQDEEKKVTDAWLDTVDQAERTATFKAAETQNKATA